MLVFVRLNKARKCKKEMAVHLLLNMKGIPCTKFKAARKREKLRKNKTKWLMSKTKWLKQSNSAERFCVFTTKHKICYI